MNHVIMLIFQSLWFSIPMYVANAMPVFARRVPFLDVPVDMGKSFRGKPILGSHKTYRGFVFGVLGSIAVVFVQKYAYMQGGMWQTLSIIDYGNISVLELGFLLGFGALFGDSVKSFFKRRIGIESGKSWLFFDQVDYILGALLFVSIVFVPSVPHLVSIIIFGCAASFLSSFIGYHVGLKEAEV